MFQHDARQEQVYSFSRLDSECLLSTVSNHRIELEDRSWPTAEHYYQAKKFTKTPIVEEILAAEDGLLAYKLGNRWWKMGRNRDWKQNRRIMMTRCLYIKTQAHPEVKDALLETGEERIVETSLYDHYWGIGRDQRGENMMGQIWMDIRAKIKAGERARNNS